MVESNGVQLTEQEAELYDRQIRLWGVEAQKRLHEARILVAGLDGLGAEVAKNLILAGVKSLTMMDDQLLSAGDFCAQFLAPQSAIGKNRAEASLKNAQKLNTMVALTVDTDTVASKPDEFFTNFDVVCLTGATTEQKIRVGNACREAKVKYFAADVWGMYGTFFSDLQEHEYTEEVFHHKVLSKPEEKLKTELVSQTVKKKLTFPPFQSSLDFDFRAPSFARTLKRNGPALPLVRVVQKFRDEEGRNPAFEKRAEDYSKLLEIRDSMAPEYITDAAFEHVFAQISPATAITGGAVSHEVIKAITHNEIPHKSLFFFDPTNYAGYIVEV